MKLKLLFLPRYHCNPNTGEPDFPPHYPPLGIATLTSYLKENHVDVEQDDLDIKLFHHNEKIRDEKKRINLRIFMDERKVNNFFDKKHDSEFEAEAEKIMKLTDCKGFDIIGFSLMPTDNPSSGAVALALAKILKEKYEPIIIIGGSIRQNVEEKLLTTRLIDFRIRGHPNDSSGEIITFNFCRAFEEGLDLKKIPGVHFVENGECKRNLTDFGDEERCMITRPCFEGLPMDLYKRMISKEINGTRYSSEILVLPYFFMKGCPHNCAFCSCSTQTWWGKKDPEEVAADLQYFSKKYKTRFFYFHNSTVNPIYEYAERIAKELIKQDVNIMWSDCANFFLMDRKLLRKLKDAGAARLVFGFESASMPLLKYIGKNYTVSHAEKILRFAHEINLWSELDLICGFPYESEVDVNATIMFLKKNKKFISACSLNKFWVDGRFGKYPQEYGIKLRDWVDTHLNWATTAFDEIYGLPWEKKIEQSINHFNMLQEVINKYFYPPPSIHELFFNIVNGLTEKGL
ncbi:MAG: radical SAM protein [Candidatus Aenigmarchaeota archaeon]|nr:radical SAM protein [Candidatus Aenigmarchaeota archaeon]